MIQVSDSIVHIFHIINQILFILFQLYYWIFFRSYHISYNLSLEILPLSENFYKGVLQIKDTTSIIKVCFYLKFV
jgi:hypothetical protein